MLDVMRKNENKGKYLSDKVGHAVEKVVKTKHRDRLRNNVPIVKCTEGKKIAQMKKRIRNQLIFFFFF